MNDGWGRAGSASLVSQPPVFGLPPRRQGADAPSISRVKVVEAGSCYLFR